MTNVKQSILVQRQIPEHVRESYPVFVEFIKLYYDFLQETQSQNLEKIRDIDTTLDEFVEKFKDEVAKNFPAHLATDQRLLLKHIREFYLARGSEASYKFLFRTLFAKEATLFYPGTQVLRVSDGKWTQDVSVFVKIDATTSTLFPLEQQFVTITTSKKTIQTFVNKVNQYSDDIYEVFIQRDYVNEIEVNSLVSYSFNNVTYSGNILKCPSKISIFKPGKGFKIGDLYALKTSIGRGCVVKITKTDSNGGIKAVQVIRFGLDYESTFYSYLSSKDITAFEYVHPLKLNAVGAQPSYTERSGGFVDYGFASKQTYFAYDNTIPVGNVSNSADRYYADSSYVGDIQQQFYSDQTINVIDEDLAVIQIDLGAVAKYPGYYSTVDGFISDEVYIHDGNYYQSFSYVIKVEEELKKYSDILKALVHPAGTKSFSEYKIQNILKLSATAPLLFRILSLPVAGKAPSLVEQFDTYSIQFIKSLLDETLSRDEILKASEKRVTDSVNFISGETLEKIIDKAINDSINTNTFTEILKSEVEKFIIENNIIIEENISNKLSKILQDTVSQFIEEFLIGFIYFRNFTSDSFSVNDDESILTKKDINDTISTLAADILNLSVTSALVDSFFATDTTTYETNKSLIDSINSMTNGRIALSPYDGESFFDVFDDYQTYTTIS
jgi:hypothetical protein